MSRRAQHLYETAECQVANLASRLSAAGDAGLTRPCPGRTKLGDGTVGAVAAHSADNYHRIAGFLTNSADGGAHQSAHHVEQYASTDAELPVLLARLTEARTGFSAIRQLSDHQLDLVPPAGAIRFADGARTLEQILASLLNHQQHQIDALAAALS